MFKRAGTRAVCINTIFDRHCTTYRMDQQRPQDCFWGFAKSRHAGRGCTVFDMLEKYCILSEILTAVKQTLTSTSPSLRGYGTSYIKNSKWATDLVARDKDSGPREEPRDGLARRVLQEGAVELHRAVLLLLRWINQSNQGTV